MNRIACTLMLVILTSPAAFSSEQASIRLDLDFTAVQAVLDLFDGSATEQDVAGLLQYPGVQATIAQTQRFDSDATEQAYVDSLWQVINGEEPDLDPFRFVSVKDRLSDVRRAVSMLSARGSEISESIESRLVSYTPPDVNVDTRVYVVLGGTSDGWAPGDGNFYVALHYFRDDLQAFTSLVTHETYHILQRQFFASNTSGSQTRVANMLIANLIAEGTATLVGNPMTFDGQGRYLKFLRDKHSRNMNRIEENFALFEALYWRATLDEAANPALLYNLGFSGSWDSPLYFVGFRIAEGLEKHLGKRALVDLLATRTGDEILQRYVQLYTEQDDPMLIPFTEATESRIAAMPIPTSALYLPLGTFRP